MRFLTKAFILLLFLSGCDANNKEQDSSENETQEQNTTQPEQEEQKEKEPENWEYSENKDEMTDNTSYFASTYAKEKLEFDFLHS